MDLRYNLHRIFKRRRTAGQVLHRYLRGVRHWASICVPSDSYCYDKDMGEFLRVWLKPKREAGWIAFPSDFVDEMSRNCSDADELRSIAQCTHFCYQEGLDGLRWELVRALYERVEIKRESIIIKELSNISN